MRDLAFVVLWRGGSESGILLISTQKVHFFFSIEINSECVAISSKISGDLITENPDNNMRFLFDLKSI